MGEHVSLPVGCFTLVFFSFLGQKTVLTNVQEELDRMTRKPDSLVTANSPTENEA